MIEGAGVVAGSYAVAWLTFEGSDEELAADELGQKAEESFSSLVARGMNA